MWLAVFNNAVKGQKYWKHPLEVMPRKVRRYYEQRSDRFTFDYDEDSLGKIEFQKVKYPKPKPPKRKRKKKKRRRTTTATSSVDWSRVSVLADHIRSVIRDSAVASA